MRYIDNGKRKIREAAAISLQELNENKERIRELNTELFMIGGYIGFIDDEDFGVRLYIFKTAEGAEQLIKEAKKMKYRTAGRVEAFICIANKDVQRPHLQHIPKNRFYSELYK